MANSQPLLVLQWVLLAFFLTPLIEVIMAVVGFVWNLASYSQAPGKFQHLVIQITTVGREPDLVQQTVDRLRRYGLTMSHEIWVVVEPGSYTDYVGANRVIVVPEDFRCLPIEKARALEYSRLVRVRLRLDQPLVKIILVDDDTLPSRQYIYKAFNGNYDVCQGVTVPNRWYAVGGWRHFILSHLDNIRTRNCLIYCACTQGVTQKPLFVHGEGLCITGRAEAIVTWNRKIVASDDLVFGTNAAYLGLSWGYFYAAIQLISPWTFKESLAQRRRWTWGNFDAIGSRQVMPLGSAILKAIKYAFGFVGVIASTTGAVLLGLGYAKVPPQAHQVYFVSLGCWFGSYGLCGFINSGGAPNRELRRKFAYWRFRICQTFFAILFTPLTALLPIFVITYSVLRGRPRKFIMIRKSNEAMNVPSVSPVRRESTVMTGLTLARSGADDGRSVGDDASRRSELGRSGELSVAAGAEARAGQMRVRSARTADPHTVPIRSPMPEAGDTDEAMRLLASIAAAQDRSARVPLSHDAWPHRRSTSGQPQPPGSASSGRPPWEPALPPEGRFPRAQSGGRSRQNGHSPPAGGMGWDQRQPEPGEVVLGGGRRPMPTNPEWDSKPGYRRRVDGRPFSNEDASRPFEPAQASRNGDAEEAERPVWEPRVSARPSRPLARRYDQSDDLERPS
jgi:hypothetical protein